MTAVNTTTTAFWIDFLTTEADLARGTTERHWEAIPLSMTASELTACIQACQQLGFPHRANQGRRSIKITLRRERVKITA